METFNLKVALFVSLFYTIWQTMNLPENLGVRGLAIFLVLLTTTIQGIMVNDIARAGGWRKENLFENISVF